jgi:hypothetical protein
LTTSSGISWATHRASRALNHRNNALDVLVGERRLLGQPTVVGTAHDDPLVFRLAAQLATRRAK